jgi:hypothetical protein
LNVSFVRIASIVLLTASLVLVNIPSASADFWGARKWTGQPLTFPNECLHVGLNIQTGSNPDKHNVEVVNTCATDETVDILLDLFNADGSNAASCFESLTNRAQCQIQHTTPTGGWWFWEATMHSTGDFIVCSEFQNSYGSCFTSQD